MCSAPSFSCQMAPTVPLHPNLILTGSEVASSAQAYLSHWLRQPDLVR